MKNVSPLKAIREHCLSCSGNSKKEVANCLITQCNLYPYRMGKNPNRKGIGTLGNTKGGASAVKDKNPHSTTK